MRAAYRLIVLPLAIILNGTISSQAAQKPELPLPCPGLDQYLPRLFAVAQTLGRGDVEAALDVMEKELPRPFVKSDEGVLPVDQRAAWRSEFRRFEARAFHFESIDLVGTRLISTQAAELMFIANGSDGPVFFRFSVFRYGKNWRLTALAYSVGWERVVAELAALSFTRPPVPLHYELKDAEVAQSAGDQQPQTR